MSAVLLQQLEAMDAQIGLLKVMVAGMRHTLSAPKAEEAPLLPGCAGIAEEDCGRRNPAAILTPGGMGGSGQRMCSGCGKDPAGS